MPTDTSGFDLTTLDSAPESGESSAPAAALAPVAAPPAGPAWPRALGLGLAGALTGAVIWTLVAVITDLEVGYVAVLVGGLAGVGVRVGARNPGARLPAAAVALAVVGLLAARYMSFAWIAGRALDVSPLSPSLALMFPRFLDALLSPFDALWLVLATAAAYRTAQPGG